MKYTLLVFNYLKLFQVFLEKQKILMKNNQYYYFNQIFGFTLFYSIMFACERFL